MSPRKRGNAENVISPRYCCCTPQGSRTLDDDRLRLVGSEILSQNPQVEINQCSSFIWDSLCLSPTALKMASAAEHNTHMEHDESSSQVHRNLSITVSHLAARGRPLVPMGTVKSPPDVDTKLPFSADTERAADWWATH